MLLEKIRKRVVPLALAAGVLCAGIGAWRDILAAKIQQGIAVSAAGTKRKGHLQFARRLLNLVSAPCAD